jgi:tetratricopeptide (TPR) repeat protein
MTPGELRLLRSKAKTGDFTELELAEVEPLIALSDVPEAEKDTRIERIEARSIRGTERRRQLRSLSQPQAKEAPRTDDPQPAAELEPAALPEVRLDVGTDEDDEVSSVAASEPNPAKARQLTEQGDKAHRGGQSARAEALYSEALAVDHKHANAYRGLGRVAFDRGSYALAARRLRKAVRFAPRSAGLRIELGDALYKSFDYDGAHAQYQRAADLGSKLAASRLAKVQKKR